MIDISLDNIIVIIYIITMVWIVWDTYFGKWECKECGQTQVGHIGKRTGFRFERVCEDCCFEPMSEAQYRRAFGMKPYIKRVK